MARRRARGTLLFLGTTAAMTAAGVAKLVPPSSDTLAAPSPTSIVTADAAADPGAAGNVQRAPSPAAPPSAAASPTASAAPIAPAPPAPAPTAPTPTDPAPTAPAPTAHPPAGPPAAPPPAAAPAAPATPSVAPPAVAPSAPTHVPPPAPAPPAESTVTIVGTVEHNRYGSVQVAVTFTGSAITKVQTLQVPTLANESRRINQSAAPVLAQEVMVAQSAQIDTVSGATYTSEGYAASVQSAIDQHG
ncbi:FMN-binding protein [Cellulomonas sp. URHD0024]|uniref:FMN-binding protein n=1 Tax=Cellulomonas sp. URHD0024 TaxID=1302620 RepID=UPI000409F2C5|nr:FMN-binding protein [Cellulomonas sp. URHD0024]